MRQPILIESGGGGEPAATLDGGDRQGLILRLKGVAARLRQHSLRMTSEAGSGHPTTCMSSADLIAALFFYALRYETANPLNPRNDRVVLSKGHAAPILYAAWAEAGAFPFERLMTLRRIDSELEGHPTPRLAWSEVATGSLGQGLSIGVGMALAGRLDALGYNVYVLMGDGETAEGSVWEAAALASHHRLHNLTALVDINGLGQSGRTACGHDVESYKRRFEAFGWRAAVIDGHDMEQVVSAFEWAKHSPARPSVILAKTFKGRGVSFLEDKDGWHGKAVPKGSMLEQAMGELAIEGEEPTLRIAPPSEGEFEQIPGAGDIDDRLMDYWHEASGRAPRSFTPNPPPIVSVEPPDYEMGFMAATREAYGVALAKLGRANENVVALDADVKNSTFSEKFLFEFPERFIECYIAEQNMIGVAVGLQTRGKIPFASSFACFLTRAFDQIRMAGVSRANIKLCGSHVGVSIGEDGPSQMGLEDIAMMRAVAGSVVLYPSDAVSAERVTALAAAHKGIVYIRASRPKTPVIYPADEVFAIGGCKTLRAGDYDKLTVVAAGVTVHEALGAHEELRRENISVRVIDLYSVKPVDRDTLLKAASETDNLILTVEDHYAEGGVGDAVLDAVGAEGVRVFKLAVRGMPRSGKPEELLNLYGISAGGIANEIKRILRLQL
ncbi:MAG: transketolase [Deltaproteobacteria bacterium]